VKYLCNELYRHLIPGSLDDRILYLSNEECENCGRGYDLSEIEGMIGQPFYVNKPFLDRMPKLKWVQITGAGYDRADVEELKKREIILTNTRGVMSISIAEDVFAKMLFFSREIRHMEDDSRDRHWDMFGQDQWMCSCYTDLYGKTLGILGYGSIGSEIAKRAAAFGMKIHVFSRHPVTDPLVTKCFAGQESLWEFYGSCDFLVLALPLTADTHHMIDRKAFLAMKESAVLINVARGPIVDTQALLWALEEDRIRGAALDVFEQEPLPEDSVLWHHPKLFLTPHKAGMGDSWKRFIGELIVRNIGHFELQEALENRIIIA